MIGLAAIAAIPCGGCAVTYTDEAGAQHTIGLVDIAVKAPADPATLAGNVVEVTSVGISVGQTAQGTYVTAGYNQQTTAVLRDNALVLGNPITAIAAAPNNEGPP
jgi:hypothetical protein